MDQRDNARFHCPVLLKQTIDFLNVFPGGLYVDATVGGGGHAEEILRRKGRLIGIDCDPEAILAARQRLVLACPPDNSILWRLARGNFKDIKKVVESFGESLVDGVIFDLGVSSYQLTNQARGFSFNSDISLDMRMDPDLGVAAADLVNALGQKELRDIFLRYGDEEFANRIAGAIVAARKIGRITTGKQLASIVGTIKRRNKGGISPSTKVFQALRIVVNDEINNLEHGLPGAVGILKTGGRMAIIGFHSGEDRIVKVFFKDMADKNILKIITDKPVVPALGEVAANPRARSAKLRVAEKL